MTWFYEGVCVPGGRAPCHGRREPAKGTVWGSGTAVPGSHLRAGKSHPHWRHGTGTRKRCKRREKGDEHWFASLRAGPHAAGSQRLSSASCTWIWRCGLFYRIHVVQKPSECVNLIQCIRRVWGQKQPCR